MGLALTMVANRADQMAIKVGNTVIRTNCRSIYMGTCRFSYSVHRRQVKQSSSSRGVGCLGPLLSSRSILDRELHRIS
jgi:hypothetical protein